MALIAPVENNLIMDASDTLYPSQMRIIHNSTIHAEEDSAYYFGYVIDNECRLNYQGLSATLSEGMYFAINSNFTLAASGSVMLVKRIGYNGLNTIGGPVESKGRLHYIDGCTSTLLVSPAKLGDPCLNLLHFPADTIQSTHTHPTIRMGTVINGSGFCHLNGDKIPLQKGSCFYLKENEHHSFSSGNEGLNVIAYHPDTDWGPTDEVHPMKNRTFLK